jgi:uncharacterized protein (TIGR00255 family)
LEKDIKKLVSSYVPRGKVDVSIQFEFPRKANLNIMTNNAAAKHIHDLLQRLQKDLSIPGDINLATFLAFKDIIFENIEENFNEKQFWEFIKPCLEQALLAMRQMQENEGEELSRDILQRLKYIENLLGDIEIRAPESLKARKQALQKRVKALCVGVEVDEGRMFQEIAVLSDKSDITEELVRAKNHVKQFIQWLDTHDPIGRKLDFLIQEINREVNTLGAKVSDSEISLKVVDIKNEMEKVREQVQNVM